MLEPVCAGSVTVDVAVDQSGNSEATIPAEQTVIHGVTVMGYINIPGSLPVHPSWFYSKDMLAFVRDLFNNGLDAPDLDDGIVRHALVTRNHDIVHAGALHAMSHS